MRLSKVVLTLGLVGSALAEQFTNPVIYEDFADNDISRGPDGSYYLSASSFHYSPGAPILKSDDLVNWEFIGHSVPSLSWASKYNLSDGENAYNKGIWASTLRYRASTGLWYWIGCIEFSKTHIYTAPAVTGPWTLRSTLNRCYYDCGLLIDDDDTMYVVSGRNNITMAQLSADGLQEVKRQPIFSSPTGFTNIEGNRLYKRNGVYYVLDDQSSGRTLIWKSDNVWGPYTYKLLVDKVKSPVPGGYSIDQGSLVETDSGDWYFMSFVWAYPSGRMPILAPITWGDDGFPILTSVNGYWNVSYDYPLPKISTSSWLGVDTFEGTQLAPAWEWNHNPDPTKYSVQDGLTLNTATVTYDLFKARNTLTHRMHGPVAVGTLKLNVSKMMDGDRAGLAAFRDESAWIGVARNGDNFNIVFADGLAQDSSANWATISTGTIVASVPISQRVAWFRVTAQITPSSPREATFEYSTDGVHFTQLGDPVGFNNSWSYFMGLRFGIFNYATKQLGGSVKVLSFESESTST